MDKKQLKKALREVLTEAVVFSEEYQDKYYLSREILEKLPLLSERSVYAAIDFANGAVEPPRKTGRFIDAFISYIQE
ncbi:MAG TPA: hypothetical protein VHO03_12765 [Ignavibacteriales bacterium]|nr:hypothetical protein [Ignavibacteriales bacterium]